MTNWNLKMLIEKRGFTQASLAKRCGVSEAVISYVVRGKRVPSEKLRNHLAEILCVKPEEI